MHKFGSHTTYSDVFQMLRCGSVESLYKILYGTQCVIKALLSARTALAKMKKILGQMCSSEALVMHPEMRFCLSWYL
jgi:hypothetical protein